MEENAADGVAHLVFACCCAPERVREIRNHQKSDLPGKEGSTMVFMLLCRSEIYCVAYLLHKYLMVKNNTQANRRAYKMAAINIKIDDVLKDGGDDVLREHGLNTTQAITLFWQYLVQHRRLPFIAETRLFTATDLTTGHCHPVWRCAQPTA